MPRNMLCFLFYSGKSKRKERQSKVNHFFFKEEKQRVERRLLTVNLHKGVVFPTLLTPPIVLVVETKDTVCAA